MQLRAVVFVGLTALLTSRVGYDTAVGYFTAHPADAPTRMKRHVQLALAQDNWRLLGQAADNARRTSVAGTARAVLASSPLSALALRQLALAWPLGRGGASQKLLLLAERVSRRELGTQVALLGIASRDGDAVAAVSRLGRVLTVLPESGSDLHPVMAAALADPGVRRALLDRTSERWFSAFAAYLITSGDAVTAAELVLAGTMEFDASQTDSALLLRRLIDGGRIDLAIAVAVAKAKRGQLDAFEMTRETTDSRWAPFTWRFVSDDTAQASLIGEGTAEFEIQPGRSARVAERITNYPVGDYRLAYRLSPLSGAGGTVQWELKCPDQHGDKARLLHNAAPVLPHVQAYSAEITIARSCPSQLWQLTISGAEGAVPVSFHISDLRLASKVLEPGGRER
jgi:hypothetical protein